MRLDGTLFAHIAFILNQSKMSSEIDGDDVNKVRESINSEWEIVWNNLHMNTDFYILLCSLAAAFLWIIFATFYLSRFVGFIVTMISKAFLPSTMRLSISSLSISPISGKVMFRDVSIHTANYSIRITDGWFVLRYWKWYSNVPVGQDLSGEATRLFVSLYGVQCHIYNCASRYEDLIEKISTEEVGLQAWQIKALQLIGKCTVNVVGGEIVVGSRAMPQSCVLSVDSCRCTYTSKPSSCGRVSGDPFMHHTRGTMDNARLAFVPNHENVRNMNDVEDKPPRVMGDGYVLLQSSTVDFFHSQDYCGFCNTDQTATVMPPRCETSIRLGANTVINYGPWADRQRDLLYSYLTPHSYAAPGVTRMPRVGELRRLVKWDVNLCLLHDAQMDILYVRDDIPQGFHLACRSGSHVKVSIPWIYDEEGVTTRVSGQLLWVETTTTLSYQHLLRSDHVKFDCHLQYPRQWNAHMLWLFKLHLSKAQVTFLLCHQRMFMQLFEDWGNQGPIDLTRFTPYTCRFDIVAEDVDLRLLVNDYNWVDATKNTNRMASICGRRLSIKFDLPFTSFSSPLASYDVTVSGDNLALSIGLPEQSPMQPILRSLHQVATSNTGKGSTTVPKTWTGWRAEDNLYWLCVGQSPSASIFFQYESHVQYKPPLPYGNGSSLTSSTNGSNVLYSNGAMLPYASAHQLPEKLSSTLLSPWDKVKSLDGGSMDPDRLFLEINIERTQIWLYGILVKTIFDFKENYAGLDDEALDIEQYLSEDIIASYGNVPDSFDANVYRPMETKLVLRLSSSNASLPVYHQVDKSSSPNITIEHLVFEMDKRYRETRLQVNISPAQLILGDNGLDDLGYIELSALQFRGHACFSDLNVPVDAPTLEYAWMVDVDVGTVAGVVQPYGVRVISQWLDLFIHSLLAEDDKVNPPSGRKLCQHMLPQELCEQNADDDLMCPTEDNIKYIMVTASIAGINVSIQEDNTSMDLTVPPTNFVMCNLHDDDDSLMQVNIRANVQLFHNEVLAGELKIDNVDINFSRTPTIKRRQLLIGHDSKNTRLPALCNGGCGCRGNDHLFANPTTGVRPGLNQSLLRDGESVFPQEPSALPPITRRTSCKLANSQSSQSYHTGTEASHINLGSELDQRIVESSLLFEEYKTNAEQASSIRLLDTDTTNEMPYDSRAEKNSLTITSNEEIAVFITPLAVDLAEQLCRSAFTMMSHSQYVIHSLFTQCARSHHEQPLIATITGDDAPDITVKLNVRKLAVVAMQCGLVEKTITYDQLEFAKTHVRTTIILLDINHINLQVHNDDVTFRLSSINSQLLGSSKESGLKDFILNSADDQSVYAQICVGKLVFDKKHSLLFSLEPIAIECAHWPKSGHLVYDVYSPLLVAWTHVISRLTKSFDAIHAGRWSQTCMASALTKVLNSPPPPSKGNSVNMPTKHIGCRGCPSCQVLLALMRHYPSNRDYMNDTNDCGQKLLNNEFRQHALIAVLSHWQMVISALRLVTVTQQNLLGKQNIKAIEDVEDGQIQLPLYYEMKERQRGKSSKSSADLGNIMELSLPMCFDPLFKRLRLSNQQNSSVINMLCSLISISIRLSGLKMTVVTSEVRHRSHPVVHLDTIRLEGTIEDCKDLKYNAECQGVALHASVAPVTFIHQFAYAVTAATDRWDQLCVPETPKAVDESEWATDLKCKVEDYMRSVNRQTALLQPNIPNPTSISGVILLPSTSLEARLTELIVSITFNRLQLATNLKLAGSNLDFIDNKLCMERTVLQLSQIGDSLSSTILSLSVQESSCQVKGPSWECFVNVGPIDATIPMHPGSIHSMVVKHGAQLNEQLAHLSSESDEKYSAARTSFSPPPIRINVKVRQVLLTVAVLPSLTVIYKLCDVTCDGRTDGNGTASMTHHYVTLSVREEPTVTTPIVPIHIELPTLSISGKYVEAEAAAEEAHPSEHGLTYNPGGYIWCELVLGTFQHILTTDLLNQLLFVQDVFATELADIVNRITSEKIILTVPTATHHKSPTLYALTVRGQHTRCVQMTATTVSSVAVRLAVDQLQCHLTNRWIHSIEEKEHIFGSISLQLSIALGQLQKTAMFEEADVEFQRSAHFVTQLSGQNLETQDAQASYLINVNRPMLFVQPTAIDKAVVLWLNYKNAYDFWEMQRSKMDRRQVVHTTTDKTASSTSGGTQLIKLSLSNGLHICMPLYSSAYTETNAALLINLERTEISVHFQEEMVCRGSFNGFRVHISRDYDATPETWTSLEEEWSATSNFVYFPEGTYDIYSRTSTTASLAAEWRLSVIWNMKGVRVDADSNMAKLIAMLVTTISGDDDTQAPPDDNENGSEHTVEHVLRMPQGQDRSQAMENELHEQTLLLQSLQTCGASEATIETERRKVKQLEGGLYREFRHDMAHKKTIDKETDDAPAVQLFIDVKVDVDSGECSLRTEGDNITTVVIPSVALSCNYSSVPNNVMNSKTAKLCVSALLSRMPEQTKLTPHILDFVEQSMLSMPPRVTMAMHDLSNQADVSYEEYLQAISSVDVVVHVRVESSQVYLQSCDANEMAADCLFVLPEVSCVITNGGSSKSGISASISLSKFLLTVFSPLSMERKWALRVEIDGVSFSLTRSTEGQSMDQSSLKFSLLTDVAGASFHYDMRRLKELMSFPKAWYRRAIVRRLFFGDTQHIRWSPTGVQRVGREWSASVKLAVACRRFAVMAHMSSTMGKVAWTSSGMRLLASVEADSKNVRYVTVSFDAHDSSLTATGGLISGHIVLQLIHAKLTHRHSTTSSPSSSFVVTLDSLEGRLEWMSHVALLTQCTALRMSSSDDWSSTCDQAGNVNGARVGLEVDFGWDTLCIILTKSTVTDIQRIAAKLTAFFQEQLASAGQMVWTMDDWRLEKASSSSETESMLSEDEPSTICGKHHTRWEKVLDMLTEMQSGARPLLPLPTHGTTYVGGGIRLAAGTVNIAAMSDALMTATEWALLTLSHTDLRFAPTASYVWDEGKVAILLAQSVLLHSAGALLLRVTRGRTPLPSSSTENWLKFCIHSVHDRSNEHTVMQLLRFPALDATLRTKQQSTPVEVEHHTVHCSFVADFHDHVYIQTNTNALFGFLPALVKAYASEYGRHQQEVAGEEVAATDLVDCRKYACDVWEVQPCIRFIDKVKWDPPGVDLLLQRMGIYDQRHTIPKWTQRIVMDGLDEGIAVLLNWLLKTNNNDNQSFS